LRARIALLALTALAMLALAAPASAPAADSDVLAAWGSEDRALDAGSKSLGRSLKKAQRVRFRRGVGPIVTGLRKLERLTVRVRDRVKTQTPSTASGSDAKELVLDSLNGFVKSLRSLRGAIQAASKGRVKAARKLLSRSSKQANIAQDDARAALVLFEEASKQGSSQQPPPSGGSQPPPSDGSQPPPSDGGSQPPPSGGGSQPPPDGGGSQPPPDDGSGGGGTSPPPDDPPGPSPVPLPGGIQLPPFS
jgi:hypothetical protein